MTKTNKPNETALVVKKHELVLEGDPEQQLEYAQKAATALMKVVGRKPKPVIINGKQYLEYGDWQTLARFFGSTAGIEWTKPITQGNQVYGYEARAVVYRQGIIISSAEASCLRSERNWANRDEFAIKSMAQTRAAAKALRNGFGWVAELAGYSATPAEEVDGIKEDKASRSGVVITAKSENPIVSSGPSITHQKRKIWDLLNTAGEKAKTKKEAQEAVSKITGLELVEDNYEEIINRLTIHVQQLAE